MNRNLTDEVINKFNHEIKPFNEVKDPCQLSRIIPDQREKYETYLFDISNITDGKNVGDSAKFPEYEKFFLTLKNLTASHKVGIQGHFLSLELVELLAGLAAKHKVICKINFYFPSVICNPKKTSPQEAMNNMETARQDLLEFYESLSLHQNDSRPGMIYTLVPIGKYRLSDDEKNLKEGILCVKQIDDSLGYVVINPLGKRVEGIITKEELNLQLIIGSPLNLDKLQPFLRRILQITSTRKHTTEREFIKRLTKSGHTTDVRQSGAFNQNLEGRYYEIFPNLLERIITMITPIREEYSEFYASLTIETMRVYENDNKEGEKQISVLPAKKGEKSIALQKNLTLLKHPFFIVGPPSYQSECPLNYFQIWDDLVECIKFSQRKIPDSKTNLPASPSHEPLSKHLKIDLPPPASVVAASLGQGVLTPSSGLSLEKKGEPLEIKPPALMAAQQVLILKPPLKSGQVPDSQQGSYSKHSDYQEGPR